MPILDEQEQFSNEMNKLWYETTDEKLILTSILNKLLTGRHFKSAIDIGAGPGLLAQPLYDNSDQLTLLELLPIYKAELSSKFPRAKVVIESFENYQYDNYDLILLSHVLYYIPQEQWIERTNDLVNKLNRHGMLIVILLNARWIFDIFQNKLNDIIEINSIENNQYIQSISTLSNVISIPYDTTTSLPNDDAVLDYLAMFFRLDKEYLCEHCKLEIAHFKNHLIGTASGYELLTKGDVIVLSK